MTSKEKMRICFFLLVVLFTAGKSVRAQTLNAHTKTILQKTLPSKETNGRWIAWSQKPAIAWQDAFVTGNGRHGMMQTGEPGKERLICVYDELFLTVFDRNKIAVANIAGLLPKVRQMADADSLTQAAKFACEGAFQIFAISGCGFEKLLFGKFNNF